MQSPVADKSWNDLLFSFRTNLAKANPGNPYKNPKLRAIRERQKGQVYFVQRPDGLIKIGFTANLPKRFRELQLTEHPDVVLIGSVKANRRYEKRIHKMFGFCRSHREWFRPVYLLALYIGVFLVPTEAQERFLDQWRQRGGIGIVAYSIDDVIKVIHQ